MMTKPASITELSEPARAALARLARDADALARPAWDSTGWYTIISNAGRIRNRVRTTVLKELEALGLVKTSGYHVHPWYAITNAGLELWAQTVHEAPPVKL